jgi:hypothetical protein
MEDFFHVLQRSFIYLQVREKKRIKAGEELFCDYLGDIWFDMETTNSKPMPNSSIPPPMIEKEMVRDDGVSAATPCGVCGEPASPQFSYVSPDFFYVSHYFHLGKGGGF